MSDKLQLVDDLECQWPESMEKALVQITPMRFVRRR
jgi:hypothetical protein